MTKHFLITRPNHDKETSYLSSFSKAIVEIVKDDKNIHLTCLESNDANRKNLEGNLSGNKSPRLVFLNGHGTEVEVWGYDDEVILDKKMLILLKAR